MSTFEKIAENSSNICVGALAFLWGDPSGGTVAAAGLAGLGILGLALRRHCAETACRTAAARAVAALRDTPEFARADLARAGALLEDRPTHASLTPRDLLDAVKAGSEAARVAALADALHARIPFDGDDDLTRRLLRLALGAAMRACYADATLQARITRELLIDTARQTDGAVAILARIEEKTDAVLRRLGGIEAVLASLGAQSAGDLQLIAGAFGATEAMGKPALVEFLTGKGAEYRALRQEIDAIEDGYKRLSNLKAAAREAIAAVRLDEVEEILARVQEVELEEAARTAELRAENALLRGRPDQAFQIFSAAADSFAAIDPLEPARRRYTYMKPLYAHGMRHGGTGLARAIDILRHPALDGLRTVEPALWARVRNNLAAALQDQGHRAGGPEGTRLLAEAVAVFRQALTIRTREDHPEGWAMTQMNLANALRNQGIHAGGPEGAALLAEAVAAYRQALTIRTREDHPEDWAMTQMNLATALTDQGVRTAGPEGAALLAEAVAAFRRALDVHTREDHPAHWAMTHNNLANALQQQGMRTDGPEGAVLLAGAVVAYRQALDVHTREDHPVPWGSTQMNLATALRNQGARTGGPEGAALLAEAMAAYRRALTVRTREDHPEGWAMTMENMARAQESIADHDTTADPTAHLRAALEHAEAALGVYDPENMAERHGAVAALRDRLRARLCARLAP